MAWARATAELAAGPSVLDQLTLAEFLTSGGYDTGQIRRARLAYRRRRDRLAAALSRQGLQVTGDRRLQAVVEFSRTDLERAVVTRASQHGVAVDGLELDRADAGPATDDGRTGLVIGYSRPPGHAYTTALARLCAALPEGPAEPEGPAAAPRLLPLSYPRGPGEPGGLRFPYRRCAARSGELTGVLGSRPGKAATIVAADDQTAMLRRLVSAIAGGGSWHDPRRWWRSSGWRPSACSWPCWMPSRSGSPRGVSPRPGTPTAPACSVTGDWWPRPRHPRPTGREGGGGKSLVVRPGRGRGLRRGAGVRRPVWLRPASAVRRTAVRPARLAVRTACPHWPNGAGGSSDSASRNGRTALARSGEPKMS